MYDPHFERHFVPQIDTYLDNLTVCIQFDRLQWTQELHRPIQVFVLTVKFVRTGLLVRCGETPDS